VKFFHGCRPQVYIHGAKLRRDKKTGKRLWCLTLIVTMTPELASKCAEVVERAFDFTLKIDNGVADMLLVSVAESMTIDFFAAIDDAAPACTSKVSTWAACVSRVTATSWSSGFRVRRKTRPDCTPS